MRGIAVIDLMLRSSGTDISSTLQTAKNGAETIKVDNIHCITSVDQQCLFCVAV